MRNNKTRKENSKKMLQNGKNLLDSMSGGDGHLDKKDWPEDLFEISKTIKCPKCGCNNLCNSGGGNFGVSIVNSYICFDCKSEFDIYG